MSKQKHIAIKASKKSISSMILSILMLLSMIPLHSSTIYADGSRKAIMNGTGNISKKDVIYFGVGNANIESHKGKPIQWIVLDNTDEKRLFLLSKTLMGGDSYGDIEFNDLGGKNEWQGSKAQNWCKNFSGDAQDLDIKSLTTQESKAIIPTTKDDKEYKKEPHVYPGVEQILQKDKVFFLSAEEADTNLSQEEKDPMYGQDEKAHIGWWLRSPYMNRFDNRCGDVERGEIFYSAVSYPQTARPAFNLDTTKVLFTSPAKDIKKGMEAKDGELHSVVSTDTTEWKLTLIDRNRTFQLDTDNGKKVTIAGNILTIPYKDATTGTNEYISAIIVEENGTITHYGTLKAVENSNTDKNGEVTVELPDGFDKKTDKLQLYLINEQLNGDKKTDYSSGLIPVDIPKESLTFEHKTEYNIPEGKQGITYTAATALSAKGGTEPYEFTVEPKVEGLSINGENKLVYARPKVQGATTATIKVTDSANPSAEKTITINIGKVTAQQSPQPTEYTVTMETDGNGTAKANGEQQAKVKQGTPVLIQAEATNESEFKFKEWKVSKDVEEDIFLNNKDALTINPWNFTMPAKHITIKAIFGKLYQIDVKPNNPEYGTAKATVDGVVGAIEKEIAGTKITLKAIPKDKYEFVGWQVESGNVQLADASSPNTTFTMPEGNVTITAIFEPTQQSPQPQPQEYTVTVKSNNTTMGKVAPDKVEHVAKDTVIVEKGNKLTINGKEVIATAENGYKFKNWTGFPQGKKVVANVEITAIFVDPSQASEGHEITISTEGNGTASSTPNGKVTKDTVVTLKATPNSGHKFVGWQVVRGNIQLADANAETTTFTMPDEDVEVKANFKKKSSGGSSHDTEYYNITTKTDRHGTVEARSKAKEGTEVSVTVSPDKGYKLDEITVTDRRGRDITIKETNRENRYKFTMPARDVTVEATFKQIKQEQPSKPTTPPTIPPTNNNKPIENNIIKKQQTTVFTIGSNIMTVITDGKATQTTIDAKPFLSQGRVMIPVRYAAESLGMQVEWNKQTQTVVLKDRENTVMIPIKTNKIIVGNQEYTSDVTPILKNGRTYLTISNIAKALRMRAGQDVKWDNKIKQVTIIKEVEVR